MSKDVANCKLLMSAAQVATVIEGHADEYRITAERTAQENDNLILTAKAKAEALTWAAQLVRENICPLAGGKFIANPVN